MKFNPKELIDDFKAAGFTDEEAIELTREEALLRRNTQRKSDIQQAKVDRRQLGGFGRVE